MAKYGGMKRDQPGRPWHLYLLALAAVAVAVLAVVEIGPPSSSARTSREVVTAEDGVVQSTVTGSGNVQAGTDVNVNFKASGSLAEVYVSVGQHVQQGQLLAALDPTTAQLSLDQAEQSLTAAQDNLTAVENGTSTGSSSGSSTTPTSYSGSGATTEYVSFAPKHKSTKPKTKTTTPTTTRPATPTTRPATSTPTTTTTTPSPASIASAQASVYGAEASLQNAKTALANTKLYAPISGTVASLSSMLPGDAISAGSSSNASSSSSSSNSSSGSGGTGGTSTAGSLGSSSSSSSSGASSSPFAEIVNTDGMTMNVSFSESDISKINVGKHATVTLDALPGVELGAHVSQISTIGTSSSGVVSFNATLTFDQSDGRVRPGMSASASVIASQAQGVTVPNAAVSGAGSLGTVDVLRNGKTVSQQVVVGLRGDSRTQVISGLSPGDQVVIVVNLPSVSSSTTPSARGTGTLGGGGLFGGGGLGGGGGLFRGGGGGGGGAFFRGGGG